MTALLYNYSCSSADECVTLNQVKHLDLAGVLSGFNQVGSSQKFQEL